MKSVMTYYPYFKTEYAGIARKRHTCRWCGGGIEKGDAYLIIKRGGGGKTSRMKYHEECIDAWDQANLHCEDEWFEPDDCLQDRGKYPCPNASHADLCCDICRETPFRQLARGDEKPALKELKVQNGSKTHVYVRTAYGKLFALTNECYREMQRLVWCRDADAYLEIHAPYVEARERANVWLAIPPRPNDSERGD